MQYYSTFHSYNYEMLFNLLHIFSKQYVHTECDTIDIEDGLLKIVKLFYGIFNIAYMFPT